MYAVVKTGGKQYRVEQGQTLEVERLGEPGSEVALQPVLVVDGDTVLATPDQLAGASVTAQGSPLSVRAIEALKSGFRGTQPGATPEDGSRCQP